jgi:hypothetical protein
MALAPAPTRAASRSVGSVRIRRRLVTTVLACVLAALTWTGMTISLPTMDATSDGRTGPPASAELLSEINADR